jgi:hypothetical protein
MGLYVIALLNGGKNQNGRVIKPETIAMMMDTQYTLDPRQMGWGLGFQVYGNDLWGCRVVGHAGSVPFGFTSQMLLVPDRRLGVLVFSNSETYAPGQIAWGVLKLALGVKPEPLPKVAPDRSVWPKLEGYYGPEYRDFKTSARLYLNGIGSLRVAKKGDDLVLIYTWQGKKEARPLHQVTADDPYFYWIEEKKPGELPHYLAFQPGANGKIYIIPGGLDEYVRLGPGRKLKAELMVLPGKLLGLVNPF